MHKIQLQIHKYLASIGPGYKIPKDLLEKFGKETQKALVKQFEREDRKFHLTMGNVGRPACQLQFEQSEVEGEKQDNTIRNLYGDICEDIVLFLLHASGIKVLSELQRTSVTINNQTINGEYDVILDLGDGPSVWDIKSASEWAFKNKFQDITFDDFIKEDYFGYTTQLFLYAIGTGSKAGGWIVFDKSSGQIGIMEVPKERVHSLSEEILRAANETVSLLSSGDGNRPLLRSKVFNPRIETFNRVETGNTILEKVCTFCKYKWDCWPTLSLRPQAKSKAKDPKMVYYVEYKEGKE